MKKIVKRIMYSILIIVAVLAVVTFMFLQKKTFGKKAEGSRLERIKKSAQFRDGAFQNASTTPMMVPEASYMKLLSYYTFNKEKTEPDSILPSVKSDFHIKPSAKPEITWFGHSSLFIQLNNKNILVDPVFSDSPSPVSFFGSKRYATTNQFSVEDFPVIDYVFITHDHYDHLDYETILQLKDKAQKFYCPLGVGAHLEYWGIEPSRIVELDWWEESSINSELKLVSTPARHFSGRGITDRGNTLWTSFVLLTPAYKIFLGGDSGYDTHFKTIGEKYEPFDIAFLECGQYHPYWALIHMMPEETAQAAKDLNAKVLQPIHWGKFTLALHKWDDPINRVTKKADELSVKMTTPMIGEKVVLDSLYPDKRWWEKVKMELAK